MGNAHTITLLKDAGSQHKEDSLKHLTIVLGVFLLFYHRFRISTYYLMFIIAPLRPFPSLPLSFPLFEMYWPCDCQIGVNLRKAYQMLEGLDR